MELQSPSTVADPEGLVRDEVRRGEQLGTVGQVERVHVPLEHGVTHREMGEQRIGASGVPQADRLEADLAHRCLLHLGSQGPREELRAEADAEDRDAAIDRVPGDCPHLLDERLLVGVLHVVGAAEDDEAADLVEVGCRVPVQRLPDSWSRRRPR